MIFNDDTARINANHYRKLYPEVRRGAGAVVMGSPCLIFGNDDFGGDARTRHEVELVKEYLSADGISILGFGLSDDEYTWVILAGTAECDHVRQLLDRASEAAFEQ